MPPQDAPAADLAVATRGLTKRYGRRVALTGPRHVACRGPVYGFLGPNGAGKTTRCGCCRAAAAQRRHDQLFGAPYTWHDRKRLFRVGSLIETPSFYPYMSGRENLRRARRCRAADGSDAHRPGARVRGHERPRQATRSRRTRWA